VQAIYLVGDSHADVLHHGLAAATTLPVFAFGQFGSFLRIPSNWEKVKTRLGQVLKPSDIVVWQEKISDDQQDEDMEQILHPWRDLYEVTRKAGARLVLFGDNPYFSTSAEVCAMKPGAGCSTRKSEMLKLPRYLAREKFIAQNPGVLFFDQLGLFCSADETCSIYVPGTSSIALTDENHLNEYGGDYLAPFICSFLTSHGLVTNQPVSPLATNTRHGVVAL